MRSWIRRHRVVAQAGYAMSVTVVIFWFVWSVASMAQSPVGTSTPIPPELFEFRRYAEQGALFLALMIVLFFYRRDFQEQHDQALQYQTTLIAALNENTRANAQAAAAMATIASAIDEMQRTVTNRPPRR